MFRLSTPARAMFLTPTRVSLFSPKSRSGIAAAAAAASSTADMSHTSSAAAGAAAKPSLASAAAAAAEASPMDAPPADRHGFPARICPDMSALPTPRLASASRASRQRKARASTSAGAPRPTPTPSKKPSPTSAATPAAAASATATTPPLAMSSSLLVQRVARKLSFVLTPCKKAFLAGPFGAMVTGSGDPSASFFASPTSPSGRSKARGVADAVDITLDTILRKLSSAPASTTCDAADGPANARQAALERLDALTAEARASSSWQALARVLLNTAAIQLQGSTNHATHASSSSSSGSPTSALVGSAVSNLRECISLHTAMGNASAVVHARTTLASALATVSEHEEAAAAFKTAAHSYLVGSAHAQQTCPGRLPLEPLAIRATVIPYLSYLIDQGQHKEVERFVSLLLVNTRLCDADKVRGLVMLARSKRKQGLYQQAADVLHSCSGISHRVSHAWNTLTSHASAAMASSAAAAAADGHAPSGGDAPHGDVPSSTATDASLRQAEAAAWQQEPSYASPDSSASSPTASPFSAQRGLVRRGGRGADPSSDPSAASPLGEEDVELRRVLITTQSELARILQYNLSDFKTSMALYGGVVDALNRDLERESAVAAVPFSRKTVQLARVLYDAAICHTTMDPARGHAKALGAYEEALSLLTGSRTPCHVNISTGNNNKLSCRIRLNYARSLRAVDFPDRALEQYNTIEAILTGPHGDVAQLSENGTSAALPIAELYAHVGHCFHYSVREWGRAEKFYTRALNLCGVDEFATTVFEHIRRTSPLEPDPESAAAAAAGNEFTGNSTSWDDEPQASSVVPRIPSKNPFPSLVMPIDMICWLCESYAHLLIRIQRDLPLAKRLLHWRIAVGLLHADPCVPAHLTLCYVLDVHKDFAALSKLFEQLIQLPLDAMTTLHRLEVVSRYAYHCHFNTLEYEKASALYAIALELNPHTPQMMCQYASCLCCCAGDVAICSDVVAGGTPAASAAAAAAPTSTGMAGGLEAIRSLYLRALELTEIRLQDAAHHAALVASRAVDDDPSAGDPRRGVLDFEPSIIYADCAVFFHDKVKDATTAAELYQRVWADHPDDAYWHAEKPHLVPTIAQSKANYAQLLYFELGNRLDAETYYTAALAMAPMSFTICSSFADFLVATLQEQRALAQLMRMGELFPEHAPQIYHRIARLEDRVEGGSMASTVTREESDHRLRLYCLANGAPSDTQTVTAELILGLLEQSTDGNAATDLVSYIHGRMHNNDLAHQCYKLVVPKFPHIPTLLANYARLCTDHLHKPRLAKKFLSAAMRSNPQDTALVEMMADLIATHFPEEMATAEALVFANTRQQPTNAAAHIAYATFLATHVGSPLAADASFRTALALKPKDAGLRATYAAFLERQFYATQDTSVLERMAPSASAAAVRSFDLHPALVQTLKMFDEAEAMDPECAQAQFLRGFALARRQRIAEAWLCYQTALTLDPHNPQIVKVAASFVHDRHVSISNGIAASARVSSPTEGTQLTKLASLANALYSKAIQLEAGADSIVLASYSRFLYDVMHLPVQAGKVADMAHAAVTRMQDALRKEQDGAAAGPGIDANDNDPDDLLV